MINSLYEKVIASNGVCYDSRKAEPGQIFFAFTDQRDGNQYAKEALAKGCSYAVVDRRGVVVPGSTQYILVEDACATLQELAKIHRSKFDIPIIGITGSNGKTTTKELTAAVLAKKYNVLSTKASYNSGIGVPIMVLMLRPEHEIAVFEMGANHVGEIAEICEIAQPTHGMITNISAAHIGEFGSLQNIIDTKKSLFTWLRDRGGHAFVHSDDEMVMHLVHDIEYTSYGLREGADTIVSVRSHTPFAEIESEGIMQKTHLFGEYNVVNMAAALAVGSYFEVPLRDSIEAIGSFVPNNNRSQVEIYEKGTLIIDCYNANPVSMHVALDAFMAWPGESSGKIAVLGGMKELGQKSQKAHANIVEKVRNSMFSEVYFVGSEFIEVRDNKYGVYFETIEDLITHFVEHNSDFLHKTIFLKSSLGTNLLALLPHLRTMMGEV
jgi:UDP-N-acetylmuramoyl-tripeptide--D-alanyl-D-alanine ligase